MKILDDKSVKSLPNKLLTAFLKRQRQEKGETMRSLSEKIGTPHSFIGKVENQERRLDVVEFATYCRELGVCPHKALDVVLEGMDRS